MMDFTTILNFIGYLFTNVDFYILAGIYLTGVATAVVRRYKNGEDITFEVLYKIFLRKAKNIDKIEKPKNKTK